MNLNCSNHILKASPTGKEGMSKYNTSYFEPVLISHYFTRFIKYFFIKVTHYLNTQFKVYSFKVYTFFLFLNLLEPSLASGVLNLKAMCHAFFMSVAQRYLNMKFYFLSTIFSERI
jgi:hypothetical protein